MLESAPPNASEWSFYGREKELDALVETLRQPAWFFLRVSGRRRIGKTTLVRQALERSGRGKVAYLQVEDEGPAGVVASARRHLALSGVSEELLPTDLASLAARLVDLAADGWVVVLDEFQYFHKRTLYAFNSHLQFEVDRILTMQRRATGGIVLLGSLQTEMSALLANQRAPLYGRLSGGINLGHLDAPAILRILELHTDGDARRLLFYWGLFQGIPKYWRDVWALGVLNSNRREVLERLFFRPDAPLHNEGKSWLVDELRGRYDLFLRFIAEHPGCTRADIVAHANSVTGYGDSQPGFYLRALEERYELVGRVQPALESPKGRKGRYFITDNFLRSWLAALADPVAMASMRPVEELIGIADQRLEVAEGATLEHLVAWLYEERSRLGTGDFPVDERVRGWWDRTGAEVDLIAQSEELRSWRVVTCKRSPDKLVADLTRFDGHIARFEKHHPLPKGWRLERVAIAPTLTPAHRQAIERAGYVAQDLGDLTRDLVA